ncbi:hypothetical protein M9Y10_017976 [Tritrichomonas musculus]|uniref:SecA family profile domain-containing protein n=1 Tax=Tritrichomonas musculus TaxID=1915356 RepID=A0ABR2HVS3_9EUKA
MKKTKMILNRIYKLKKTLSMPLIDPSIQYHLIKKTNEPNIENCLIEFFNSYLLIASRNIYSSYHTIEASVQFKNDLFNGIEFINHKLNCFITKADLINPSITNYYNFIYKNINMPYKEKKKATLKGTYYISTNKLGLRFFQFKTLENGIHHWYLTDTPVAILCVDLTNSNSFNWIQIKLEVDLMEAAGYKLVLCVYELGKSKKTLFRLIRDNQFSEIHYNTSNDIYSNCLNIFLNDFKKKDYKLNFKKMKTYFYFYVKMDNIISDNQKLVLQELKKMPHVKVTLYSGDLSHCFENFSLVATKPFAYCKNGFDSKYIRVLLSNIPLYDTENDNESFTPSKISGLGVCYIEQENFLNWKKSRIPIFFEDQTKNNSLINHYVNYEDIHKVKIELYVSDQLTLAKAPQKTIEKVDKIFSRINEKIDKNGEKTEIVIERHFQLKYAKFVEEWLSYVSYVYNFFQRERKRRFLVHKTQIYTAYQACKRLLKIFDNESFKDKDDKRGIVFQVDTGEGKTCIVCLIAAVLAKMGKTVHITSSNIRLSMRDFEESFKFFQKLNLKTAVLLHSNELPLSVRKKLNINETEIMKDENNEDSKINPDEKSGTNSTKPEESGTNSIKPEESGTNSTKPEKSGTNSIKPEESGTNSIKPEKSGTNSIKPEESGTNSIKPEKSGTNSIKHEESGTNSIKPEESGTNSIKHEKSSTISEKPGKSLAKTETKSKTKNKGKNEDRNFSNSFRNTKTIKIKLKTDDTNEEKDKVEINPSKLNNNNDKNKETIFADNADRYFKENTQQTDQSIDDCYTNEFYKPSFFKNSTRMNFNVCGIDEEDKEPKSKANIIFSTFVNFECFYLKMVELAPGSLESYFTNCSLLIDEADSILIDEIANGTIISRSMKSNATEILKFVYSKYQENIPYEDTFRMIQEEKKWSLCKDLTEDHIKKMYKEIEQVHSKEYINGKRYSIETRIVKNDNKKKRFKKRALNLAYNITKDIVTDFVKEFTKDVNGVEDEDDEDNDDDSEDEEEEEDIDDSETEFNYIVPFGYDSNGMLEKNKEFDGFVQQFIAIKEGVENNVKNMVIKDVSMSYLYVSHPIFVKLYRTVCGFTGTIGNKNDKDIFRKEYGLTTFVVPRHHPNQRVEFPKILCKSISERNEKIVSEVLTFHEKGNPVLVIFQKLTEINKVEELLLSKGIRVINIFDGKDDFIKPDEIAGVNGAISLGTNVCGRGTNIRIKGKPLHVIISYFSSNTRVMNQAFGRTARQGRGGSYRIICLKRQYYSPSYFLENVKDALNEFNVKNKYQQYFVNYFRTRAKWIFQNYLDKQEIRPDYIKELRKVKINVNRIIAYKYKFPICMSLDTFLIIQEQKIFSIYNCPNSKFTWRLFQRYFRELILESWSLTITEIDQKYSEFKKSEKYKKELEKKVNELIFTLKNYFPSHGDWDIVSTFMHIFRKVRDKYEKDITKGLIDPKNDDENKTFLLTFEKCRFFAIHAGFKPFTLVSKSGARIFYKNYKKTCFIKDPELKYEQRTLKNKFSLLSITSKIDDIFNNIFKIVNNILGSKTFLRFFLRRTLAGCEFGVCLNMDLRSKNETFNKSNPYCIIDKDPLLVFTILVKSMIPVMAIILISLLVYIGVIGKKIAEWFTFPANAKESLKKTATIVVNAFAKEISKEIFKRIIKFLEKNLNANIEAIRNYDQKSAELIETLRDIFTSATSEEITGAISDKIGSLFEININWSELAKSCIDPISIMKISVYLLLLMASFIMNYRHNKQEIKDFSKDSEEYTNKLTLSQISYWTRHRMLKKESNQS